MFGNAGWWHKSNSVNDTQEGWIIAYEPIKGKTDMKNIFETDPESHYRFSWNFKVSVNVSWRQFAQEKFVQDVCDILEEEYFLPPIWSWNWRSIVRRWMNRSWNGILRNFTNMELGFRQRILEADILLSIWWKLWILTASRSIKALSEIFWCSLPIRSWSSRSLIVHRHLAYRFV